MLIAGAFSLPSAYALTISIPDNLSEMPGAQIVVPVQIDQQILIDNYNLTIYYDPTILEVQGINHSGGTLMSVSLGNCILVAFMSMNEISLDEKLFDIKFLVLTEGKCALTPEVINYQDDDLYLAQVIPGFFKNIIDQEYILSVSKAGTGLGIISSSPDGINCGGDCNETYIEDIVVTLTAVPEECSYFVGWSGGGCSGTGSCQVTVDEDVTITATFNKIVPNAVINSIIPNPMPFGKMVEFSGSGGPSTQTVTDYHWCIVKLADGVEAGSPLEIGTTACFFTNTLPVGDYRVHFRVKNSHDAWSEDVTRDIIVNSYTFDVDDNGTCDPYTDAILIARHLLMWPIFYGNSWIDGAVSPNCNRCTPQAVKDYVDFYRP